MKKFLNTPLRISAGCDIISAFPIKRVFRSFFDSSKPQGKKTGCADCVMMHDKTTLPPETRGQEGGNGNPWVGRLQEAHMGNESS